MTTAAKATALGQVLTENWWLQKKSVFSMGTTWIICQIKFTIPSE